MKPYKATQNNSTWGSMFPATESQFAFNLIRHTKVNPNRLQTFARPGCTWFGSYENYDARIKRRWPIRFFLAKGLTQNIWWPLQRILLGYQRAERLRWLESEQIALEEAVQAVIGGRTEDRGAIFALLTEALPHDPDLVRRVDVSLGLSRVVVPSYKEERQELAAKLKPRAGMGTMSILEYPEGRYIKLLDSEIQTLLSRIGKDAKALAISSFSVKKPVESLIADM